MPMVVAGRLLSGLAEGLLDVSLMVLVARALPAVLRPRMFSLFAAMWILPSVLGPVLTGFITEQVGWRWVFIGALILLPPVWALIQPAIRVAQSTQRSEAVDPRADSALRNVLPAAVTAAVSVFALTLAGELLKEHTTVAAATILVAIGGLAWSAVKIMPIGTFRARRGLPAVITLRGAVSIAFGTPGAFLPLLLTLLHDFSPTTAGISLTITGVTWAFGSWLQGRRHSYSRVMVLRIGLGAMAIGLTLTTLLVVTHLPVWIGLSGWAIAGVGIGLSSPSLAVLILDLSDDSNQGRNNSAGQMAVSISIATGYAIAGTMVAFAAPAPGPAVFGLIIGFGAVIAILGFLITGRVRPSR
ncbi:MAG TPA: MFS transporter, partial [Jiangellaceae bacterium]|nr:MFS transporter [Jiangellaceae bacterium]